MLLEKMKQLQQILQLNITGSEGSLSVGVDVCALSSASTILSPLLGRAQSIPPVCRCHGWTSSFAYICMVSNGAAADRFQSRLSSWTPAQSCRHSYTARQNVVRPAHSQADQPQREL